MGAKVGVVCAMMTLYCMLLSAAVSGAQLFPPDRVVLRPGGNTTLYCFAPDTAAPTTAEYTYQWYFNNEIVTAANYSNILMDNIENTGGIGTLTITDVSPDFHVIKVQCAALLPTGMVATAPSDTTTIYLVPGYTPLIVFLEANTSESLVHINWTTPVLSTTDNVTSYCVDVVNARSSLTLHTECGISKTMFSFPIPSDIACNIYFFTVIAMGDSGGNISRYTKSYPDERSGPNTIWESYTVSWVQNNGTNMDRVQLITVMMSAPVCTVDVTCIERDTGNNMPVSINGTILYDTTTIAFTLQSNRHCSVTITATNTAGPETSEAFCISTYDVSNVSVMERGSVVGIMTNYVEHSSANGVLLNFAFINESATEVDLARSEYLILDRNSSFHYTLPFELTAGKYRVNAYDIEMDGTLAIGTIYPAAQNEITPESKTAGNPVDSPRTGSIDCNISSNDDVIIAKCNSSGFQMIARLSETQRDFLYVNQSTNTEMESSEATCTIEVEDEGEYQVVILPIKPDQGIVAPDNDLHIPYEILEFSLSTTTTTPGVTAFHNATTDTTLITDVVVPAVVTTLVFAVLVLTLVVVAVIITWIIHKKKIRTRVGNKEDYSSPENPDAIGQKIAMKATADCNAGHSVENDPLLMVDSVSDST